MCAPLCPPRCCLVLIFVTCPKLRKLWDASAMTCHMVHMSCGETRGTGLPLMRSQCSMPATPVIPINIAGKSGSMYGTKSIFIASNRESTCADSFKRLWKVCLRKSLKKCYIIFNSHCWTVATNHQKRTCGMVSMSSRKPLLDWQPMHWTWTQDHPGLQNWPAISATASHILAFPHRVDRESLMRIQQNQNMLKPKTCSCICGYTRYIHGCPP